MPAPRPDSHLIVDAHSDLLLELVHRRAEEAPFGTHWLPVLRRGGVGLQVCAIYVSPRDVGDRALRSSLEQVAAWMATARERPDVVLVRSAADLDRATSGDPIELMLSIEGAEALGNDPALIDLYHALGVRMIGLTHFQRNAFADGNGEPAHGGLSGLGRELVARIQSLGTMMLDLAHASERTFADVLEHTTSCPLLVSHSGCRALHDDPRNVSDAQLRALAARDGVIGIYAVPVFLGGDRTSIDRMVDHVLHALDVAGPDHVGLGGDFTAQLFAVEGLIRLAPGIGVDRADALATVDGLSGPDGYPALVAALQRRGVTGATLDAVLHGNFLRLFRASLPGDASPPPPPTTS